MNRGQQNQLKSAVQNPPGEAGIELSNWNWKVVRQFLKQSFDLGLSRSSCLNYLHRKCDELSRSSWPWYAAFRPWYRPGDFTESGRGPWECSPDADCLRLVRRYADQLLLVDEEEKGKFHLRVDNGYGVWRDDEARLTTLILGHRLRRTYFTPLSTFPGSGPGRR